MGSNFHKIKSARQYERQAGSLAGSSNLGERVEMTDRKTFRMPTDFLNATNDLDYI